MSYKYGKDYQSICINLLTDEERFFLRSAFHLRKKKDKTIQFKEFLKQSLINGAMLEFRGSNEEVQSF